LKDPERRARYAAIQGLADIGDDSAVAPLLDHLLREHEDDIEQYYIMVALDRMQQNPEDLLIQAVRNRHRPEGERLRAAAVLKRWGTLSTLSMLRSAIEKSGSRDEVSSQILRGTIAAIETRFELI
jgi:HEAT repeat protein